MLRFLSTSWAELKFETKRVGIPKHLRTVIYIKKKAKQIKPINNNQTQTKTTHSFSSVITNIRETKVSVYFEILKHLQSSERCSSCRINCFVHWVKPEVTDASISPQSCILKAYLYTSRLQKPSTGRTEQACSCPGAISGGSPRCCPTWMDSHVNGSFLPTFPGELHYRYHFRWSKKRPMDRMHKINCV